MMNYNICRLAAAALLVLILSVSAGSNSSVKSSRPYIVFFYSHHDRFWDDFIACMNACASGIGVELQVYCADHSRDKMIEQVKVVVSRNRKPDYIMFAPFKSAGYHILALTEKFSIKTFIVNSGLSNLSKKKLAESGIEPAYLVGEFLPGDEKAGQVQMDTLLAIARKKNMYDDSKKIQATAINGNIEDGAGLLREKGLVKSSAEHSDLVFHQIFSSPHWDSAESRAMFPYIMKRYPGTRVIWCGNDGIALGVLEGCRDLNLKPGKDILIGGIDWSDFGLAAVRNGNFAIDIGGHFFDGAFALIVLYDHYHGYNRDKPYISLSSEMSYVVKQNLNSFSQLMVKNRNAFYGSVNYSAFSKKKNPGIKKYGFSIQRIFSN